MVYSVGSHKTASVTCNAHLMGKSRNTAAPVPAKSGHAAIGIEIAHPEIVPFAVLNE
jgi:hypothetical protein